MDQIHPSPTHPALTTQDPLPRDVMPGAEWVVPLCGDQSQPACLGAGQPPTPPQSETDRLCSTCMSLGRLNSTHWEEINNFRKVIVEHHHSFDALIISAREGCHLCRLLLTASEEGLRSGQEPGGARVRNSRYRPYPLNVGISLGFQRIKMTVPQTGIIVDEVQIEIKIRIRPGVTRSGMIGQLICKAMDDDHLTLPKSCLPSSEDTNTGSFASLSRIKAWLDICSSSHPACAQAGPQPPPLPTRVIAVGSKGSSKSYLVSGNKKHGYYASLSHCWGGPDNRPLSTTDQTLSCRQRGIEDEAMPKTFLHAVQICRDLGIEYIWIDSLCIIQEQETQEDWAKEAPRMGQVYGNSILNISAAAAADSTRGCFKKRLGLKSWPCPVVLFGQACYLIRYPTTEEESFGDPGDAHWDKSNALARRAWVLQEQILSRRSIILSKRGLIWRCSTLSTNEKYPLGIPHAPKLSFDNRRLLSCILNSITLSAPKGPTVDDYGCWYRLVEEFMSRNLTYEEDRLPAIAGIAKRFAGAVNDNYHAGLWRHDMIPGLLWRVHHGTPTGQTKSARVPSWSWASINDRVQYSDLWSARPDGSRIPMSPLVDILDVSDPITCEDHPFGVTSRASLSLSGVLLALMRYKYEYTRLALVENGIRNPANIPDLCWDIRGLESLDPAVLVCLPVCVLHDLWCLGTHTSDESYKAVWKMSLDKGRGKDHGWHKLYCLVLQTIEGCQDTYRRVGLCSVSRLVTNEISRMALLGARRSITII